MLAVALLLFVHPQDLVPVEPGEFVMGEGDAPPRTKDEWTQREWDESPAHKVRITRGFQIGAAEVTNARFREFDPSHQGPDADPAVRVTWARAVEYCDWLSKKTGKPVRLPTEAEWEYVRRSGREMGLRVGEWCLDWYGPYEGGEHSDPAGPADGIARVVRRGPRIGNRAGHLPEDANRLTGFRIVVGEPPTTPPRPVSKEDVRPAPVPSGGPDPAVPYFVDFGKEKKAPTIPKDAWGPIFGAWNHFSTVVACPNGDFLAAWYTCVSEEGRELAQASSRLRAGSDRWEPPTLFLDVPDVNDHAPVLCSDGRRLYHFFTQSLRGWDDASDCVRTSDDSGATWSKPRILVSRDDPKRMSQPCSAFVAKDGTVVLACDGDGHRDERLVVGSGSTWKVAGGDLRKAAGKYAIHPAIACRADGAVLAFLRGPDPMPMMVSKDLGETWEAGGTPFPGIGVGQKAAALRLASGVLLLLSMDSTKKGATFVALSSDDGATWPHVRPVPGVTGYLSVAQATNGVIVAFGSRMGCAAFNEAWIRGGK